MTRISRIGSTAFGSLAAVFLAATMLLTVTDVLLRAIRGVSIPGVIELVELGLACTVFLGTPAVFLRAEHLVVDIADNFVSARTVQILDGIGAGLSFVVLTAMALCMWPRARDMVQFGDVTFSLSIPRLYYWIPVLTGVVASALVALYMLVQAWRRE
jgi:TRAP-type C4-dicarboxylate transport system permease small subunit